MNIVKFLKQTDTTSIEEAISAIESSVNDLENEIHLGGDEHYIEHLSNDMDSLLGVKEFLSTLVNLMKEGKYDN